MDGVDATTRRLSTAAATMGAGKAVLKICPRARETRNRFISRTRDETAVRADGFAQRPDVHVHVRARAVTLRHAAASRPTD